MAEHAYSYFCEKLAYVEGTPCDEVSVRRYEIFSEDLATADPGRGHVDAWLCHDTAGIWGSRYFAKMMKSSIVPQGGSK